MTTQLKGLVVRRIDLVDKGASDDPATGTGAHVVLFKRAADNARGTETAWETICRLADALVMKDASLTIEKARVRTMELHPELYAQHVAERR